MKTTITFLLSLSMILCFAQPFTPYKGFDESKFQELTEESMPESLSCQDKEEKWFKLKFNYEELLVDEEEFEKRIDTDKEEWTESDEQDYENKFNESIGERLSQMIKDNEEDVYEMIQDLRRDFYHYFNDYWRLSRCDQECDRVGDECNYKLLIHYVDTTGLQARYVTSFSYLDDSVDPQQAVQFLMPTLILDGWVYFSFGCECKLADDAIALDDPYTYLKPELVKNDPDETMNYIVSVEATGSSTGHAANMNIVNTSDENISIDIPAGEIPSDGERQGLGNPNSFTVSVQPGDSLLVPLTDLYCLHPNDRIPKPGEMLAPPQEWITNSPVIETIKTIHEELIKYLSEEDIGDIIGHDELIDIATQYLIWTVGTDDTIDGSSICDWLLESITSSLDRPFDSLKDREKELLQYKTLTILKTIKDIGENVGIPYFTVPDLPTITTQLQPAPESTHPEVENTIKVTSSGETTGVIGTITISNPTDRPIRVKIGSGNMYIPIDGDQDMLVSAIPEFTLAPGETKEIPIEASFCGDITELPVTNGGTMPVVREWVGLPDATNDVGAIPDSNFVYIPTMTSMPVQEATQLLEDLESQKSSSEFENCVTATLEDQVFTPGTETIVPVNVDPETHPGLGITLILDAFKHFEETFDQMKEDGKITTMMGGNPEQEKLTALQWLIWRYEQALEGNNVEKEHWVSVGTKEIEEKGGRPISEYPEETQEEIVVELENIWSVFDGVGVEAKTLKPGIEKPAPEELPFMETVSVDPGNLKPSDRNTYPSEDAYATDDISPPILIKDGEDCECGKIKGKLTIWKLDEETRGGRTTYRSVRGSNKSVDFEANANQREAKTIEGSYDRLDRGDFVGVAINEISADCPCTDGSECKIFEDEQEFKQWLRANQDLEKFMKDFADKKSKLEDKLDKAKERVNSDRLQQRLRDLNTAEGILEAFEKLKREYENENDRDSKKEIKEKIQDQFANGQRLKSVASIERTLNYRLKKAQKAYDSTNGPIKKAEDNLNKLEQQKEDLEKRLDLYESEEVILKEKDKNGNNLNREEGRLAWTDQKFRNKPQFEFYVGYYCGEVECAAIDCSQKFILKIED